MIIDIQRISCNLSYNQICFCISLSLSVTTRMTTNNDVPMLICHLLNIKPWIKLDKSKKYKFQGNKNTETFT